MYTVAQKREEQRPWFLQVGIDGHALLARLYEENTAQWLQQIPAWLTDTNQQSHCSERFIENAKQYKPGILNGIGVARHGFEMPSLAPHQFIVVWQAETKTSISVAEQIESLVSHLTQDTRQEVLDFTRFIYERRQNSSIEPI